MEYKEKEKKRDTRQSCRDYKEKEVYRETRQDINNSNGEQDMAEQQHGI